MMASHHDALWAKLHELELQLAAYKLLRAPRGEDAGADTSSAWAAGVTCRGRQYEAYMRRRDARREAATSSAEQQPAKAKQPQARGARAAATGGGKPMSLRCTARDTQEVKRNPTVSIPSTPRREISAALPRSRTVNGATGSPARSHHHHHHHHQRGSSLGAAPADFGDGGATTPRPFLKRGTGTGGAAAPARLRLPPRVHDLPSIDVLGTPRPLLDRGHGHTHAARHARSVSELPFDTASPLTPARARKRWGSPERPAATVSAPATDSHRDFSKGLKKLLSFVRKGAGKGGGDADPPCPGAGGKSGRKPVSKGWSGRTAACSVLDVPLDRASLDGHRFPTTRTVGISG